MALLLPALMVALALALARVLEADVLDADSSVLVARGLRIKVSEAYRFRVALPAYPASLSDVSLLLSELRPNDSGVYRCEVQHGIDDSSDAVEIKVKGVVFLYREGSARYAFSFAGAREACARIGARIATPEQLYAAYLGGYEQCDAGWLSDQTVRWAGASGGGRPGGGACGGAAWPWTRACAPRYPIQTPREACYGDMDGFPGVRNYGVVHPDDRYDVYCYAEDLNGELFLGAPPEKLTLEEARAYCRERGAEIATTGQLYAAWDGGLDRCSPGWLADGSVRYPIVTPSQRCGGGLPGVKTLFLFPNQTGFPNKHSRFNVYCFRDSAHPSAIPGASNPASDGLEAIVTVTETLEELQLPPEGMESESRGAIYSIPIMEDGGGRSPTPEGPPEAPSTLLEFETASIVPPTGSPEEEEVYGDEEEAEEEEDVWAWPGELSSQVPSQESEDWLSQAPWVLQPGTSPAPEGDSEAPRPPRLRGPPTEALPAPTEGSPAPPLPSTPAGAREVGEETGGPELSGVPQGESEEAGSSEDAPSLPPATAALPGTRELEEGPSENSGRAAPAGTSGQAAPVLPTDSAGRGGVAEAPSPGDCVPSPCHNGGTCVEEEKGVSCLCLPGYGGPLCDVGLRSCSPGWDAFQGACYRHFAARRSWEDAESQCRRLGAHLASVRTPEEQAFLNGRYREYQWIGLNDRTIEGDFLWSDGVPLLYENWNPGQPDSYFLSGENCVVMVWHDQGQWSDVPCNYHLSYTCKMGLVSCGPPPELPLARVFGSPQPRYEVDTVLLYRCHEGLVQRNLPLIRCREDGSWESPQIACVPGRPAHDPPPAKSWGHPGRLPGQRPLLTPPSSPAPGPEGTRP
ncbi:brevican core protein [Fukomys damarensis]|uniref:brevican core protein n=1 Tax=Fukomys damarensis TaxID=885580 RepID=UPI0014550BF4|nr:brevican core protein [Fukomys damarensis]